MSKKKKIIVLSCMIALLAVTAVFNFVLTGANYSKKNNAATVSGANYFSQHRTERMTTRNEMLLQLDSIIEVADDNSAEKSDAVKMKLQLTEITEQELLLESLVKAQGFEDTVVTIGLKSDNVNVIVRTNELTQVDAIKIYTIMNEEIGADPVNVKIIPIS